MSYYRDHQHTTSARSRYHSGSATQSYGAIVGTVETNTEKPITGQHGDHLQFYVDIGGSARYQVDVNTQSMDGSAIGVYIAVENLTPDPQNPPFGHPSYGVEPSAQLSYAGLGLTDADFVPMSYSRIDSQLEAALNASTFVAIYGMMFDDGGADGKGIHETHYTGKPNQDGALAIYAVDATSNHPIRTWFFFKFQEDHIPS